MSNFRKSVRGLSAFLASLSLLGSGSASFAAGKKKAKVDHGEQQYNFDVKKDAKAKLDKGKSKNKDRKGKKGKVDNLSAAPAAGGSSKPSSVFGEISDFARKTGASFSEMSTLAKVAGVVGIGELVSILSTSRGLIERLAVQLEAAVRKSFNKNVRDFDDLCKVVPDVGYDVCMQVAFLENPGYAPIRPLINLFMWGKNAICVDRVLAFLAGRQSKIVTEYDAYAFKIKNRDEDSFGEYLLKWKPTFINRLIYKLGQCFGKKNNNLEDLLLDENIHHTLQN